MLFVATQLTAQLLKNFPYDKQANPASLKRGRVYYETNRVEEIELEDGRVALCHVIGDSDDYEVRIQADTSKLGLSFSCDCPFADEGNFCKHMVAAGLELTDYLADNDLDQEIKRGRPAPLAPPARPAPPAPPPQPMLRAPAAPQAVRKWQAPLDQALLSRAYRTNRSTAVGYVGLILLEQSHFYGYGYATAGGESCTLTAFVIQEAAWPPLTASGPRLGPPGIQAVLEANTKWIRAGQQLFRAVQPAGCLNLNPEAVAFLNALVNLGGTNYYGQISNNTPLLLSMLSRLSLPVFLGSARTGQVQRALRVLGEPVDVSIDVLTNADQSLRLAAGLERDGQFRMLQAPVAVLSRNPTWVMLDDVVAPLRTPEAPELLSGFPIQIPAADVDVFRERYFARLAESLPIRSDAVHWRDVQVEPVPRLYLREDKQNGLCADLRFGYGEFEVPAVNRVAAVTVQTIPETWDLARIHRDGGREEAIAQSLAGTTYGLKRVTSGQPYGTHALRARVHPFTFLLQHVPALAQAGFEIYGEDTLKIGKINRSTPTLRVSITSGIDWFDLKMVVEFGDQQISLHDVRKALQRGERFIKLADGSAGQIPADWLDKYRHLWKLATETDDGYRVSDVHLPLIDTLLEAEPALTVPPDLAERRQRLRSFERIQPQPLAKDFSGSLRQYQQHGVDWLHFLHEYKFGGILADDMGLGKTVQVLAFLQLLKERSHGVARAASLLVVPKSLIGNWQREAARFTAGIRIVPYLGNTRSKDTAAFDGLDIVLTTYGTMLRDIDSLRRYRFQYVILDESQAIKNPLAKSARAARLLQAEHRLVLTGTPVENNTLDLWSQLAFLNPGLLGNMDFFRQEFATPIETRGDEAAAALLRKLVYPFILRRTKAQVAPELPARTERIIYADMDSAQKKLYTRTRDRYRAELLGLIDTGGLNDARFKILEGLLRLRQIAIHPGLVESGYRGVAPKLEILMETLETLQSENHKALIFSQFVGMLKFVRRELDARHLRYMYLDGKTTDRQARVDAFQNDPECRFFLISLKAGGVGLNLTAADYVIHLDPWWNPAVEMQASDRAHRIGQDKPVFVYKLIARDTVEEKILQLQEKKRALVQSLVTTEAGFFKSLTPDDVNLLFG